MSAWLEVSLYALWVACVGQTLFVLVYLTRPWWRHFVGRALFSKSFALALVLDVTLLNWYVTYSWQPQVAAFLMCFVAAAIWFQMFALVREIRPTR